MEIEFHNREKEIEEIKRILSYRPDSIYFVYGPINSGKTELFQHLIKILPDDYRVFYINLRHIYVSKAEDFLRILFDVKNKKKIGIKTIAKEIVETYVPEDVLTPLGRFPIPKSLFKELFKEKALENVFVYLESLLREVAKRKKPILILDELQKIGDVKIDGYLIYELFNFFVGLTKESHLAHVFVITSDSLFIEKVFNEAMLQGRCDYLLVDDFDYNTTTEFLKKYGFNKGEIDLTWNYFGGKPVYLVKAIKNKHKLKEFCKETLEDRVSSILYRIKALRRENKELFQKVVNLFEQFKESETTKCDEISEEVTWTVKNNILFLDPRKRLLKPQSRLDLLAIRKLLREL
jgi:AAA+ ATPase superfamily predicted ATPase